MRRIIISIGICLISWTWVLATELENNLSQIDQLISSGKYESALDQIHISEDKILLSNKLIAWEIEFKGEVLDIVQGRESLYYLLHIPNSAKDAPGLQNVLDSVSANSFKSDWKFTVVCVELETGHIRWSRAINGLVNLGVDSRTDILYLYKELLISLDPESGEILNKYAHPEGQRDIHGLILGETLVIPFPDGNSKSNPDTIIPLYNPDSGLIKPINFADYLLLSPDKKSRLVLRNENRKWDCVSVTNDQILWSLDVPLKVTDTPYWNGDNPTFVMDTESDLGVIKCLNHLNGQAIWSRILGWGVYHSRNHQLRSGMYQDYWRPLSAINDYLLSIDESGRIYFIDPINGNVAAAPQLARNYLAMPFQYNDQLITTSFDWIRSYSIDNLIHPESSIHTELQARKAKCLMKLGQKEEAMSLLEKLVQLAPQSKIAWSQYSEACKITGNLEEECFSLCKVMTLSDNVKDDTLFDRWGLLRLYNLKGKPSWRQVEANGIVYSGTLAGDIWTTRTDNLNFEQESHLDDGIINMQINPELLVVLGYSATKSQLLPLSPKPLLSEDNVPWEWTTLGGTDRLSNAVFYRGRQFRSKKGGRVRVLSGSEMKDLPALLDDIKDEWRIHISPEKPLGYGEGVFELNENLRPSRWLIRPKIEGINPERIKVVHIQNTLKTICIVVAYSTGAALQVYDHNGVLLNETYLCDAISNNSYSPILISMNNGYLFSDRQLVWISANSDRRVWRFGPPLNRTTSGHRSKRWQYFGEPLLINGCLYVTDLDGHLCIFDSVRITETAIETPAIITEPK